MAPYVHRWTAEQPRCIALIAHGYGEHAGRYDHVARARSSTPSARPSTRPTTAATGASDGRPALVDDVEAIIGDLHDVADARARASTPTCRSC